MAVILIIIKCIPILPAHRHKSTDICQIYLYFYYFILIIYNLQFILWNISLRICCKNGNVYFNVFLNCVFSY